MTRNGTKKKEATRETEQLALRFPLDLLDRIHRHRERMVALAPGLRLTRADVIRSLIHTALDAADKKHAAQ